MSIESDAKNSLQLYNAFQAVRPNLVFLMSRTCDAKIVGYMAHRKGNDLIKDHEVSCTMISIPNFHANTEVHPVLLEKFMNLAVRPIPDTKKYAACLVALPERTMTLSLKKNSTPNSSDGRVVASATFVLPDGSKVPDVQLFCIEKHMTFNALGIPDIHHVSLFGCISQEVMPPALHKFCVALPDSKQLIVHEKIPITSELKGRFPIEALAKEWLIGSSSTTTSS